MLVTLCSSFTIDSRSVMLFFELVEKCDYRIELALCVKVCLFELCTYPDAVVRRRKQLEAADDILLGEETNTHGIMAILTAGVNELKIQIQTSRNPLEMLAHEICEQD